MTKKESTTPTERILARLEHVRPSGTGWSAWCPAHDDLNNSLSIAEGRDERVLVHCFAGCQVDEILEALGLEMSALFPRSPRKNSGASRRRS